MGAVARPAQPTMARFTTSARPIFAVRLTTRADSHDSSSAASRTGVAYATDAARSVDSARRLGSTSGGQTLPGEASRSWASAARRRRRAPRAPGRVGRRGRPVRRRQLGEPRGRAPRAGRQRRRRRDRRAVHRHRAGAGRGRLRAGSSAVERQDRDHRRPASSTYRASAAERVEAPRLPASCPSAWATSPASTERRARGLRAGPGPPVPPPRSPPSW